MKVKLFTFNPFQENTYILYDQTKECIIIDPGCLESSEQQELEQFITNENLKPTSIVCTHCHIDHVFGLNFLINKYNIPFFCHKGEIDGLSQVHQYGLLYGFSLEPLSMPTQTIDETDEISFGNTILQVYFTPGHSPASICFLHKESNQMIVGDVLFYDSIGRVDLPGGDYQTLMKSIENNLLIQDDDVMIYPGHGPKTTIARERANNPFILEYLRS